MLDRGKPFFGTDNTISYTFYGSFRISSSVVEEVKRLCSLSPTSCLTYFYFDFSDASKQTFRGFLSSLISQLGSVPSRAFEDLCITLEETKEQPGIPFLVESVHKIISCLGETYVIVDALDECSSFGVNSERDQIHCFLADTMHIASQNVHVCVTSRLDADIKDIIEPLATHCIPLDSDSKQAVDIITYTHSILSSDLAFKRWKPEVRTMVIDSLTTKAQGMCVVSAFPHPQRC